MHERNAGYFKTICLQNNHIISNSSSWILYVVLDPDILIRTSGEYRLSNFLCWQLAYTELFFVDSFWPQLKQSDLRNIMIQFNERKRRFGK